MTTLLSRLSILQLFHCGLVSAFCFSSSVNAADAGQQNDALPSIKLLEPLDTPRDFISQQVVNFADSIDAFFAGDRVYDELQESHIKIYIQQIHYEKRSPLYETKIKAKLAFPKTQKRLKLLIESEEDEDEDIPQESIVKATEESDQSVGIRYIEKKTEKWRVHTDALLRFRSEIDTVARLRIRRRFDQGAWIYNLSENIFWVSSEGLGETTKLNIDHSFAEKWLFRSATHAKWKHKYGYFKYGQDFLLFQNISKRKALTYQAGIRAISEDRPHTVNYILSARYREQVHKGWLFYEVIPAINYPIEERYKPVRSIALKLEIVFDEN